MPEQPNAPAAPTSPVRIQFAYYYDVDGLKKAGTVTCSVGDHELDDKPDASLNSRIRQ
jgi:hypothetical protein